MKIKYLFGEDEKNKIRARLEEVLNRKEGLQVIILADDSKISDYYQNVCGEHLLSAINRLINLKKKGKK